MRVPGAERMADHGRPAVHIDDLQVEPWPLTEVCEGVAGERLVGHDGDEVRAADLGAGEHAVHRFDRRDAEDDRRQAFVDDADCAERRRRCGADGGP
jgi:hypothetical protein